MAGRDVPKRAPGDVEAFVKQLLVTYKAVRLYPPSSSIPRDNAQLVIEKLKTLLRRTPEVRMVVSMDGLFFEGLQAMPGQSAYVAFAREAFKHGIGDVRFHAGVTADEIVAFLKGLSEEPGTIAEHGGFSAWLWDHDVHQITVGEMETKVVDAEEASDQALADEAAAPTETWPPEPEDIEKLLTAVRDMQDRDQRVLVRFLLEPKLVGRYLEHVAALSSADPVARLAERIFSITRVVAAELDEEQEQLSRSAAEAVMALDAETRARLIADHLLPRARLDDAVAQLLSQVALDDLCAALVSGIADDEASREGLARALHNLALIGIHSRQDVAQAASRALAGAGVPGPVARGIVAKALPERIEPAARADKAPAPDIAEALKLVDMAGAEEGRVIDEAVERLRSEVAEGFSDAEVFKTLVRLLELERRPANFASLLALIEDGLPVLLDRGEHEAMAEAVASLLGLKEDESIPEKLRSRVRAALAGVAEPQRLERLCATARMAEPGTPLHTACIRLVRTLGELSIDPLLELLASEQDMAARKALVDLISSIASSHIEDLGTHVEDGRWFFVRNVVAILGSTRDPAVLPYLARTLRHPDARVRRETIRALASVRDRYAAELLVAALEDEDAQNVALVARFLGTLGVRGAVSALIDVARGVGPGNREPGPRVEAIEALVRLGAREALPVLEQVASRRAGLLRGQRSREVAAAAEAAVRQLRASSSGGEG